ncbi:TerC family protein [Bacillus sp. FJAT-47783]|uniref:TerC family protein n=1 Tax=Bacillus sp. FJAT-47783 TaxID=2922712 RepID=UPI001FAC8281|nr:TerC family protein [Bacillus sp. FJAT-47783]
MDFIQVLGLAVSTGGIIALLKIIAIDIILSGDNAVVIAMATRNLPEDQQNKAIVLGTAGAVLLRILFATIIVYLLKIPFVTMVGGILLLWIAYKVLVGEEEAANIRSQRNLAKAIQTIILADAVMSLDNVIAVAGAAHGNIGMIALGVFISIPIIIFGSKLIVRLMEKYSWIAYAGSAILAWTAGEMIIGDKHLQNVLTIHGPMEYIIMGVLTIIVLAAGYVKTKQNSEKSMKQTA